MTTLASARIAVIGGVDTHADVHVAAACDQLGGVLGTRSFPTTSAGYRGLLRFLASFGDLEAVGVEGTGSYGSGLARYLTDEGVRVVEVNRPNRQVRRAHGKTDTVAAITAARAVISGQARVQPKTHDGSVEVHATSACENGRDVEWDVFPPGLALRTAGTSRLPCM